MFEDRRTQRFFIIALCLFYAAVRIWRLTDSCLWFDEIFSVHAAEHNWSSLFDFVAQDLIHPPLFYALLKIWIGIGGESLHWLRLLPVLFACVALVPFVLLCRELKQEFLSIVLALFLLSVNGSFIKYAQLVRMYSLLMCLSLFSIWLFARYFNRGKNLTALIAINLLLIYTHYYGWLVVGSEIVAILIFQRFKWRGIVAMTGVLTAFFLPWIYVVYNASQNGSKFSQNISWISRPGLAEIGTYAIDLIEPFYFQVSNAEPPSIYRISIPLILLIVAAAAVFAAKLKHIEKEERKTIYFLSLFSFLPIIVVFLVSWLLPQSIWGTRHLIIVAAPFTLLIATFLINFKDDAYRIGIITLIMLFSGYAFFLYASRTTPVYVWCAWEGFADDIRSVTPEGDSAKIYTFENLVAYHVWFALRDSERFHISVIKGVEGMLEDESYFLPRGFNTVSRAELSDISGDRVWLVFRTEQIGRELPMLESVKQQGYTQCPSTPAMYGMTNVFKVEMIKPPAVCGP